MSKNSDPKSLHTSLRSYSSFTEWTVIADLEKCYQDDKPALTEQIRDLVEESYETADGRRLEQHIIELADWEEFENDVFIPHPTSWSAKKNFSDFITLGRMSKFNTQL